MRSTVLFLFLAACPGLEPDVLEEEEVNLEGRTYLLATGGLNVVGADEGANDVMKLFFTRDTLINLHSVTASSAKLRMTFATANVEPMEQDPCTLTIEVGTAEMTDSALTMGPLDAEFNGYTVDDMSLAAQISPQGGQLRGISMSGFVDMRQAEELEFGTAESLCETTGDFGLPCQDCGDGSLTCLALEVDGLVANEVEGLAVTPVETLPDDCL